MPTSTHNLGPTRSFYFGCCKDPVAIYLISRASPPTVPQMRAPAGGAESAALLCGEGCVSAADGGRGRETQALLPTLQLPGDRPQTGEGFSGL